MVASDPFLLPPRSVISFSGGRTSGLMLRRVLDAFGGTFPDDRRVIFENTGKEREETLEFIDQCSRRWDVPITWLEYRWEPGRHYFVETDYAKASRNGEPFDAVIKARGMLPNPVARFCTVELKIRTQNRYVRQVLGWEEYFNAVGLRADEPKRVAKMVGGEKRIEMTLFGDETVGIKRTNPSPGETPICPLAEAGIVLADVASFWDRSDFDLDLESHEGNCDLCFLKSSAKQLAIIKDMPSRADWWAAAEAAALGRTRNPSVERFRKDRPGYREMQMIASGKQDGPGWLWADKDNDGSCGEIDECRCTD